MVKMWHSEVWLCTVAEKLRILSSYESSFHVHPQESAWGLEEDHKMVRTQVINDRKIPQCFPNHSLSARYVPSFTPELHYNSPAYYLNYLVYLS